MLAAPLIALAALATAGAADKPRSTILVLPFAASGEGAEWSGMAVAESVIDFVAQVNQDNFLTLKQVDSVLRPRDWKLTEAAALAKNAMAVGRALGASDVIVGEVVHRGDIFTIEGRRLRVPGGTVARQAKLLGSKAVLPRLSSRLAPD